MQTPRLRQPYQMTTMTSLPSPVNHSNLCSHQASKLPGSAPCGVDCSHSEMICPGDFVAQCVPRGSTSPGGVELENIFEDHGVSWPIIDEMFVLGLETYRRCLLLSQLVLSALQRINRRECAHLRDLAASADLPPNSALFSRQLFPTQLAGGPKEKITTLTLATSTPWQPQSYIHCKLRSARYPDRVPCQFPDPQQPARPLAGLLTATAALLARRQRHSAPLLHSAWTIWEVLTEEYRILGSVN